MNGGKLVIGTELNTKQFDAQIVQLERKLNDIESTLAMAEEDKTLFSTSEIQDMEAEAEKLRNTIGNLRGDFKKSGESGKSFAEETSKGLEKGVKSLKRFGLSLFGIQSMYRLVSRASSAYLSQDTELAQKLQNVWVGLGSFLAPVIEYISTALLKLLGYFNEFLKALTGVDFIARANAKALEKQAQAQNKLNKATQQYDFDVIRKQQAPTESSTGSGSGLIEIPELNQGVVEKLRKFAEILRENWDLIKNVGIALGVTFGAVKIAGLLQNIGLLIGSASAGTGIAFLNYLLGALTAVVSIQIIFNSYQKIKSQLEELTNMKNNLGGLLGSVEENTKDVSNKVIESGRENIPPGVLYSTYSTKKFIDDFKRFEQEQLNKEGFFGMIDGLMSSIARETFGGQEDALKSWYKIGKTGLDTFRQLHKDQKLQEEDLKYYLKLLEEQIEINRILKIYYGEEMPESISDLREEYDILYYELTGNTNTAIKDIENLSGSITGMGSVTDKTKAQLKLFNDSLNNVTNASNELGEQYTSNLNYIMENTTEWNDATKQEFANQIKKMKDLGFNVDGVAKKYKDLTGEDYTIKTTATFEDKTGTKVKTFADKLKELLNMNEVSNFTKAVLTSSAKMFGLTGFAQGGIVTQPTRALIGEAGYPEAVVPMTQDYLSTLASEIAKYGGSNGSVNVYLDGKLIQRTIAKATTKNDFVRNR